jgi:hypothetical protein
MGLQLQNQSGYRRRAMTRQAQRQAQQEEQKVGQWAEEAPQRSTKKKRERLYFTD